MCSSGPENLLRSCTPGWSSGGSGTEIAVCHCHCQQQPLWVLVSARIRRDGLDVDMKLGSALEGARGFDGGAQEVLYLSPSGLLELQFPHLPAHIQRFAPGSSEVMPVKCLAGDWCSHTGPEEAVPFIHLLLQPT